MKDFKIVTIAFISVIILFIALISMFLFEIYSDYSETNETVEFIDATEIVGKVTPVVIPEENEIETNKEENTQLIVEPTIREEKFEEEPTILNTNKFYYNQLDNYSKLIYTSLEEQKENLKLGNSIIKLPNKLSEIIETNNLKAIFSIAVNAFEYDNPDIFYLDVSKLIVYYERDSRGNYKIYLKNDENYSNYLIDSFNNKQEIEQASNDINNIVENIQNQIQGMSTENKIRYIHNWLVSNIKYDKTLNKSNRSNIYGAFIEKEITCAGYAKAFKYIVDKLNIECIIVQGEATSSVGTENHAWNYIKLDNKWYGVDCTWDDPIVIDINGIEMEETNQVYYTYYLKGKNVFSSSHKPFPTFYSTNVEIKYPELEQNNIFD